MASPPPNQKTQKPEKKLQLILVDLLSGQESAHQLSKRINLNGSDQEGKDLMGEVINAFSKVISALDSPTESGRIELSEVSNGKRKFNNGEPDQKTRRRKRVQSESTRRIISKTTEDGQAWRKYGQKQILNSNNPRSYFRCTHKFDQGCNAQKQVQKSEEDPNSYIITYMGNHTCKKPFSFIQASSSLNNTSCLISFESNTNTSNKNNQDGLMSPSFQSSKQEGGEEEVLSRSTVAADPTVARISEQGPDQTGLNCMTNNWNMEIMDQPLDLGQLEELINLNDFGDFGFL